MTAKLSFISGSRPIPGVSAGRENAAGSEPESSVQVNALHRELPNSSQVRETEWLLKALRPFLRVHIGSLLCVLIASLLSLCDPLIIKWLIDVVLPSRQVRLLAAAAAGLLASYIGRIGFQSLSSMLIFRTVQKMVFNLRVDLLDHLHRLSASYHDNTPVGETLFRLEQDVDKIGELGGDLIPEALRTILVGGLLLVIMFALNWRLTCVAAPAVPIFILLRRHYGRRLKDSADSAQQQSSRVTSFLQEYLSAVSQIQLLCREREEAARFAGRAADAIRAQVERRRNEIRFGLWTLLVIYGGICLVLGYGGYEVMRGALTVGGLVAFYSLQLAAIRADGKGRGYLFETSTGWRQHPANT
jgi:ABC-type bacteriocin/lantibiotic exporter with double-glycine peptidase domain